ncbi:MAG: pyridoxamine 5'-phosphate oxidase family protein [Acutalibacter sp.]|jgi:nitroimidazol reductase NimA-like FMN-containing flavoprotein (pyridoxamine 5'-phosphate oxidase superfamily)
MFREMRRMNQQLSHEEAEAVLIRGTSGVLSLLGDEGYPYGVPLSYVYDKGKLYFHCAKEGHKLDAIQREAKCSFCVIDQDLVVPEKFTTYFRSVIAFGKVRILQEESEQRAAAEKLAARYCPGDEAGIQRELQGYWKSLCMLEMTVEHLTGKEAKELRKERVQ